VKHSSQRLLIKVVDTCYVEGHGVILAPGIPLSSYQGASRRVVIMRKPDGSAERHEVDLFFSVVTPAEQARQWLCRVTGAAPHAIPAGTEVWLLDNGEALNDA
jgi:hypothetical protein